MEKPHRIKLYNNAGVIKLDQLGYINGCQVLDKAVMRIAHEDVLVAISIKLRAVFLRRFTAVIIAMNNRGQNELLRKYLYRWRINANPFSKFSNNTKNILKLLYLRYDNNLKKILAKYFNRWRYKKNEPLRAISKIKKIGFILPDYINKKILEDKNKFMNILKRKNLRNKKKKTKDSDKNRLKNLFRKYYIKKLKNILEQAAKKNNVKKLIITTLFQLLIRNKNFLLNIIKKWRFLTFVSSLAKKKLELMYKNLHVSYVEMADEIFKENSPIEPDELKELRSSKIFCGPNDSGFMRELGLDPLNCSTFFKNNDELNKEINGNKVQYKYKKVTEITTEEKEKNFFDYFDKPKKNSDSHRKKNLNKNNHNNYGSPNNKKNQHGYSLRKTMATESSDY